MRASPRHGIAGALRRALWWLALLALASCSTTPGSPGAGQADAAAATGSPPATQSSWWETFGDPQLDELVRRAQEQNPTLAAASARIREAGARLQGANADQGPQVGLTGEALRQRISERYIVPPFAAGQWNWIASLQASLDWQLDLWGEKALLAEAARSDLEAARLEAQARRLLVSGAVVQAYLDWSRIEQQSSTLRQTLSWREQILQILEARSRWQLLGRLETVTAEAELAQARRSLRLVEEQRARLTHALAELVGSRVDLPALRPGAPAWDAALALPEQLPLSLIARRPDLQAARARIAAASTREQAGNHLYYPNVNLRGFVGVAALGLSSLLRSGSQSLGAGPAISLPLFDGGRRQAQRATLSSRHQLAVAYYDAAVLQAVRESADLLARLDALAARRDLQDAEVASLAEGERLTRSRAQHGIGTRVEWLRARIRLQDSEQARFDLRADAALARVQLLLALGGDFAAPSPNDESRGP